MSDIDPDEARRAADDILSRPEFREQPPTLIDRTLDWLSGELSQFLATLFGGYRGLWFGYVVLGLGAALAVYFLWRHFPWRRQAAVSTEPAIERHTSEQRGRAEWLRRARGAQEAGRLGEAVHARYHAITAGLADVDQLSPDDSVTSGEHRRAFARAAGSQPQRVGGFGRATDRYERVWFGGEPAHQSDVEEMAAADQVVLGEGP